jgi:capsular exopolysaccharide synthesis family protein
MIGSSSLMNRTVAKNGFNVSYFKKGRLLTLNTYDDVPFRLIASQLTDSTVTYNIDLKKIDSNGGYFLYGPENDEKTYTFKWNVPFIISGQTFVLEPKGPLTNVSGEYIARWQPVQSKAAELSNQLVIKAFDAKTTVIELSIKTENLQFGKDVLNALFGEYNFSDIQDRNKLSESTVSFVDERLLAISGDLKGVEGNLESYQGDKQLVDIRGQSNQYLENSNAVSKTIKELAIQQGVVGMIRDYFSNPNNVNKLVPSSIGLNDGTLASLITQYNELQLKKEREMPLVAPKSTVLQDLNTQLANLKGSIMESLNSITKNLKLQENNFRQQNTQYKTFLSSIPHSDRVLQEIKRKQSITEGLYLYLLQKREEAAISSTAANVAHYKQIDPSSGYGPVEPNARNILLYTTLLGLFLGFGWMYVHGLLNDKIFNREDISKRITIPVIGEISQISKSRKKVISVLERNVPGEQFRAIRTNLSFLLKDKNKKVILITSCASGEGKSFISLNLASVFAIPGKKVALVEFDIRKPVLENNLQLDITMGLTDYLTGLTSDLPEIACRIKEIPTLDLYPSGSIPSNPADLLLTENVPRLFKLLREKYDYVIIDSPPAELVSDSFILAEYCDIAIFIIRQRFTLKKQLDFIREIDNTGKFKKTALIFNDTKASRKYGYDYKYEQYEYKVKQKKFKIVG